MKTTDIIDIIIPSYNQAQFLPDAIESALDQTVKCRVIVVDDGSTDNSLELAGKYPVTLVSQVNKGLASARNTGIMNARAPYCLFLDADDMLAPNAVEEIGKVIEETGSDVVAGSLKTFGTSNETIILMPEPKLADFMPEDGKGRNRIGYCAAVKKDALLEVGGYNPRMTWGWEDYDLWFDLLKRGKRIVTIPDVLWLYRTKSESMWHDSMKHEDELWAQIKKNHPDVFRNL